MFTSRAEFRLHLRIDNADRRLTSIGQDIGLIGEQDWLRFQELEADRARVSGFVQEYRPLAGDVLSPRLRKILDESAPDRPTMYQLLKRPEITIEDMVDSIREHTQVNLRRPEWKSIETEIKYEGYLNQQKRHIQQLRRAEARRIPDGFAFAGIPGLSTEVIEKMERIGPATLGQASRIPGITPAAISILNVYLDAPRRPRMNA